MFCILVTSALLVSVKNGVTKSCSVLERGRFKTSPENQREVLVLQTICINPITPTYHCRNGRLSKTYPWERSIENEHLGIEESCA